MTGFRNTWLMSVWESVRTSLWFIPSLMVFGSIALSFATLKLDTDYQGDLQWRLRWTYYGGAEGARDVLSTIATSAISVAGVVFSVTIVALTLAAQQFGPRLLRNFMSDRGNQIVLGTFIATFLFCLLILRSVRGDENEFVPYISVVTALLLGLVSLGVLIYFIHHVSTSIQAPNLMAAVSRDLDQAIERLFPEELGQGNAGVHDPEVRKIPPPPFGGEPRRVAAPMSNYIQAIDGESMMHVADKYDLFIELKRRPGEFAVEGDEIALAWPRERASQQAYSAIQQAFLFGSQRTTTQDPEFGIKQLVEVAVRALSTGINDPSTAATCIDRLTAALCKLAGRSIPSPYRRSAGGRLRVFAPRLDFADITNSAFDEIRRHGASSVTVLVSLLQAIRILAVRVRREQDRQALLRHLESIRSVMESAVKAGADRRELVEKYKEARNALESVGQKQLA